MSGAKLFREGTPSGDIDIEAILREGTFNHLVGVPESETLDFKGAAYNFIVTSEKYEFAKDISSFANAHGGWILLGPTTERRVDSPLEVCMDFKFLSRKSFDIHQMSSIANDVIYPRVSGLKFSWHPSIDNPDRGIVAIRIPAPQPGSLFLVSKVFEDGHPVRGNVFGLFRRSSDQTEHFSAAQLLHLIQAGMQFSTLASRMDEMTEGLQKLRRENLPAAAQPIDDSVVANRLSGLISALSLQGEPVMAIATIPVLGGITVPELTSSSRSELVRTLQSPPHLRDSGFNFGPYAEVPLLSGGRLRRGLVRERRGLELWHDGVLLWACSAGANFLSWAKSRSADDPVRLNHVAVIESIYTYCLTAAQMIAKLEPPQEIMTYQIQLCDLVIKGQNPCLTRLGPDGCTYSYPGNLSDVRASLRVTADETPERVAFRLVAEVYKHFGQEEDKIPLSKESDIGRVIDRDAITALG